MISLARQLALHQEVGELFASFAEADAAEIDRVLYRSSLILKENRRRADLARYQRQRSKAKGAGCADCRAPLERNRKQRCRPCAKARLRRLEAARRKGRDRSEERRRRRERGGAELRAREAARMRRSRKSRAKPLPTCLDCPATTHRGNAPRCRSCARKRATQRGREWRKARAVPPGCVDCGKPVEHGNAERCATHRAEHRLAWRRERRAA